MDPYQYTKFGLISSSQSRDIEHFEMCVKCRPGNLQTNFKPQYLPNRLCYDTEILAVIIFHYALSDMWKPVKSQDPHDSTFTFSGSLLYAIAQTSFKV